MKKPSVNNVAVTIMDQATVSYVIIPFMSA